MSLTDIHIEQNKQYEVVATFTNCGRSEEVRLPFKHEDRAQRVCKALRGARSDEDEQGYIDG